MKLNYNSIWSRWLCCIAFFITSTPIVFSQITAQGQGANDVLWLAFGVDQKISKKWTNKNAIGFSRHSSDDGWNLFRQQGVFTVREEVVVKPLKWLKVSTGLMYAIRQYYDNEHPKYIHEFRAYPKIGTSHSFKRLNFSQQLRTDIRFFKGFKSSPLSKPFSFRLRYQLKWKFMLTASKNHQLILITEFLAAKDQKLDIANNYTSFKPFRYTENRTSVFYRHNVKNSNITLDFGLMNQFWYDGQRDLNYTLLFQIDMILKDPFTIKKERLN